MDMIHLSKTTSSNIWELENKYLYRYRWGRVVAAVVCCPDPHSGMMDWFPNCCECCSQTALNQPCRIPQCMEQPCLKSCRFPEDLPIGLAEVFSPDRIIVWCLPLSSQSYLLPLLNGGFQEPSLKTSCLWISISYSTSYRLSSQKAGKERNTMNNLMSLFCFSYHLLLQKLNFFYPMK